jgi:hypothetical protein
METKKLFFEDNQKSFDDIMKAILDNELHKIIETLLGEPENCENNILEVA